MMEHLGSRIADLLAGRLSPDELRDIEAHVSACPDCAADLAWARELRERALREGHRHLEPLRVVAIGAGATPTDAEQMHVERCLSCRQEVRWAHGVEETDADGKPASDRRHGRGIWAALAAAAVMAAAVWMIRPGGPLPADLARLEPMPVHVSRSVTEPGSFEEAKAAGLESYAAGEWGAARASLSKASALDPKDAETILFLGSAELLGGATTTGAATLERALAAASDPAVRDEAAWQLANAALLAGDGERAARLLDDLAGRDGHRRTDAESLREALRNALGDGG